MPTFFIIPGFRMKPSHGMFKWLEIFLSELGYKVIKVPVAWNFHTLTQNAEEFEKFYLEHKGERNYILGFSYGAVIAFLTANRLKPDRMFLCSLSPDFVEDREYMRTWEKIYIGRRRFEDTKARSGKDIARSLSMPIVVFYGEEEGRKYPQSIKRAEETVTLAKNARLVVVEGAPHDIAYPSYQEAIKAEIQNL